jgi:D-proline reductase (dithiol) PrdB
MYFRSLRPSRFGHKLPQGTRLVTVISTSMETAVGAAQEPIDYIERTRTQYDALGYPPYNWVYEPEPPPFAPLSKPLSESKVGLVCSGGIYQQGQIAFHYKDDTSYRVLETQAAKSELRVTHFAYDLTDARDDVNVVFPAETLRDLEQLGVIGELSPLAYTFMGGVYSSRKVRTLLAPALVERLTKDEVDVVVLVPV